MDEGRLLQQRQSETVVMCDAIAHPSTTLSSAFVLLNMTGINPSLQLSLIFAYELAKTNTFWLLCGTGVEAGGPPIGAVPIHPACTVKERLTAS